MTDLLSHEQTQDQTLPGGWTEVTLDKVAQIVTGNTPPKKDASNYGQHIPFVKPGELLDAPVDRAEDNLSEKGATLARVLPHDSVLVSCIGNLGKTAISQVPVAFNQQINATVFFESVIPKFGFYYFQTQNVKDWMHKRASATTVTILNKGKFSEMPFPLTPLNEQLRIVEKIEELFTKLDAGVRSLKQARAQLKSYRRSVLKAAVEGELSREWREARRDELEPASELLDRILQERREKFAGKKYKEPASPDTLELSTVPDGWKWANIDQLTNNHDGKRIPVKRSDRDNMEGEYPYYGASGIIDHVDDYLFDGEYLLIAEDGANLLARSTPIAFRASGRFWVNNHAHIVQTYAEVPLQYLEILFESINLQFLVTGSAQPKLTQANLNRISVPLPPLEKQHCIVEEVERRLSVVDKLEATVEENLKQAAGLRQSILKQAFSGELVPQDPDDEPASVLLARIREEREATKQKAGKKRSRNARPARSGPAEQIGLFDSR